MANPQAFPYSDVSLIHNWFEDRHQEAKASGESHVRPYETDIAVIQQRYEMAPRIPRCLHNKSTVVADYGVNSKVTSNMNDMRDPKSRTEVLPPHEFPRFINTETFPEVSYDSRRPIGKQGTKGGFGSVLPRHEATEGARYFNTTVTDYYSDPTRRVQCQCFTQNDLELIDANIDNNLRSTGSWSFQGQTIAPGAELQLEGCMKGKTKADVAHLQLPALLSFMQVQPERPVRDRMSLSGAGLAVLAAAARGQGTKVGMLTGEVYKDETTDLSVRSVAQRAWQYGMDPALGNIKYGGKKASAPDHDNTLSLHLPTNSHQSTANALAEKGTLFRKTSDITSGNDRKYGVSYFRDF